MSRTFRPKLIPTLATLIGLGLLISLGTWQLRRYNEKILQEASLAKQSTLPAVALEQLPATNQLSDFNYRTISLTGQLDMSYAVLFKHRQYDHRPGFWLAAPLVLEDNRAVWTNLGWLPFAQGAEIAKEMSTSTPKPQSYSGLFYVLPQNIEDTLGRNAIATKKLDIQNAQMQWHTYDIEALLTLTPYEMGEIPAVLVLNESHSGDPFPLASTKTITKPYMTADRHKGYFLFWYITAGALAMLYLGASFGVIGSFARRQPMPTDASP